MSSRKFFSELKKKLKRRSARGGHEPETGGINTDTESVGGTSSLPQPEPHQIAQGGHNHPQPATGSNVDGGRIGPTDPLPHSDDPGSTLVSKSGQGEGGREADERDLYPRPDAGDMGTGSNQEGSNFEGEAISLSPANPSPSEGMGTMTTYQSPLPTAFSDDTDSPAVPEHVQQALSPDKREQDAADGGNLSWKSTASATARSLLRTVKESSNAYSRLKSIAECLYFILNNCEVWPSSCTSNPRLRSFQHTEVNEYAIESLAHRIKSLSESLCQPIPPGDIGEKKRTRKLER